MDRRKKRFDERWEQLKQLNQVFWKRWVSEYPHHLKRLDKWTGESPNLRRDQMVLIRERETPPTKWHLSQIIETHPGLDGKVRVATVRYHGNKYKQVDIVNLCPLPDDIPANPTSDTSGINQKINSPDEQKKTQISPLQLGSGTIERCHAIVHHGNYFHPGYHDRTLSNLKTCIGRDPTC